MGRERRPGLGYKDGLVTLSATPLSMTIRRGTILSRDILKGGLSLMYSLRVAR